MKRTVDEWASQAEHARIRVLEETRERWISLGMMRAEDAHLLESVEGPYHPNIERSREQYFSRKKEDHRMLEKKAREYYQNEWVFAKEKELRELQEQEEAAADIEVKHAIQYMIQVSVEALKLKHQETEVPGLSKFALLERKKKALEMKWLSPPVHRVNSIWGPLPYPCDHREDGESDEESLFVTQSTAPKSRSRQVKEERPIRGSQKRNSRKRRSQNSGESSAQVPKRGRITHFFSPSQQSF